MIKVVQYLSTKGNQKLERKQLHVGQVGNKVLSSKGRRDNGQREGRWNERNAQAVELVPNSDKIARDRGAAHRLHHIHTTDF